jgi:hypothetical protein
MGRHQLIGVALFLALSTAGASGQQGRGFARGGVGRSTSRFVSPTVVASWSSHENYADGSRTTLLVLWRGTPAWFSKGGRGRASWSSSGGSSGSGFGSGAGGSGSYAYQYLSEGGLTFTLEFDYDKRVVKMLDQEISLKDTNVVLVDFVDSVNGPTIVDYRWIEPGPPAPAAVPDAASDPIAGVIRRSPELFDYLQCHLEVTDALLRAYMPVVCGQMRGRQ